MTSSTTAYGVRWQRLQQTWPWHGTAGGSRSVRRDRNRPSPQARHPRRRRVENKEGGAEAIKTQISPRSLSARGHGNLSSSGGTDYFVDTCCAAGGRGASSTADYNRGKGVLEDPECGRQKAKRGNHHPHQPLGLVEGQLNRLSLLSALTRRLLAIPATQA